MLEKNREMIKLRKIFTLLLFALLFSTCFTTNTKFDKLMPGTWRGELFLDESNVPVGDFSKIGNSRDIASDQAFTDGVLPFNFEVTYDAHDSMTITFINGAQRIPVKEILWGRNLSNARDTIRIQFVEYDTYIRAETEHGIISGAWYIPRKNISIPFRALAGKDYRFANLLDTPKYDISGKWSAIFSPDEDPDTTVGEFKQNGNLITGTFMSTTGDYGFLEGGARNERFSLSSFDGGHAFLFTGKFINADNIEGAFMSGKTYKTTWKGNRNQHAVLPDATSLVKSVTDTPIHFSFPDDNNQMVSVDDPEIKNKIKVVQVMGTWCPNCKDETEFITTYMRDNPSKEIQFLALTFEAYDDSVKVNRLISNYKKKMQMTYPVLWAGKANAKDASDKLPFLSKVMAFPTLFILDKNNIIRYVHTGFSGPATSEYNHFKKEFSQVIHQISNQ